MRQPHQVPVWQRITVPPPVFRCVTHDLVPAATQELNDIVIEEYRRALEERQRTA